MPQQHQHPGQGHCGRCQGPRLLDGDRYLRESPSDLGAWPLLRHVRANAQRLADQDARVDAWVERDSMGDGVEVDTVLI